jgi:hypothetical protein
MVTVWVELVGPLQPCVVAVIMAVPVYPAVNVTAPVAEFILFPADKLVASKLKVILEEFDAVAPKFTIAAFWHLVEIAPNANTGTPTDGVVVTVWVALVGPLHPIAVAVIIVVPLQLAP